MTTETQISDLEKLPRPILATLAMHALGIDVRKFYNSQTLHRHEMALAKLGYDISRQIKQTTVSTVNLTLSSNDYQ